ncbi:hypothetical protein K438DRAFT_1780079 [Mycena galopus ATCC 62051]|nr:hypothetical protein K438DRAFT_1780079 [Mycena galopus ATCC 62051]
MIWCFFLLLYDQFSHHLHCLWTSYFPRIRQDVPPLRSGNDRKRMEKWIYIARKNYNAGTKNDESGELLAPESEPFEAISCERRINNHTYMLAIRVECRGIIFHGLTLKQEWSGRKAADGNP